jgi:hypothetical protein
MCVKESRIAADKRVGSTVAEVETSHEEDKRGKDTLWR